MQKMTGTGERWRVRRKNKGIAEGKMADHKELSARSKRDKLSSLSHLKASTTAAFETPYGIINTTHADTNQL